MSNNSAPHIRKPDAVILAGGKGLRLQSVVNDRPKALASIAGRPFIDWMLTALRSQGIRRAVLCTGHLAAMLRDYVSDGQRWGVQVIHSSEDQPLGTGGALRNALPVIDSDPVLVLNGDSLCQFDLDRFAALHRRRGSRASILLALVNDCSRFGSVELNADSGIQRFQEKNGLSSAGWINAGVYLINREVISSMAPSSEVSLERALFPTMIGKGLFGFRVSTSFIDIGTPESYIESQRFFLEKFAFSATKVTL